MRKAFTAVLLVAAISTSGCAAFKSRNTTPDEFAVARNAPLVIPPDYTLTPPAPGTATLSPNDAQQQAIQALFGGPAPRSESERQLLDQAGGDSTTIGARSTAGDPNTSVIDKGQVTQTILAVPAGAGQEASVSTPR